MTWLRSLAVGLLAGIAGLLVAGYAAGLAVDWYRIPSFEGSSGFFVVGWALAGLLAGALIGLVTSRIVARSQRPMAAVALSASLAIVIGTGTAVAGIARMLADVPPQLDGQTLLLAVELRWPATGEREPAAFPGVGAVTLGSATAAGRLRALREGPLWLDRATQLEGRWVVPGAVEIFTNRGTRVLEARAGDKRLAGFVLPLGGTPDERHLEWSEWMPRAKPGAPPLPDQFTYRYRVVRIGDPVRTETVGPFEIGTAVNAFYRAHGTEAYAAESRFRITHRGRPIPGLEDVRAAAVVGGVMPSLLVEAVDEAGDASVRLVTEEDGRPRVDPVGPGGARLRDAAPVTSDAGEFRRARALTLAAGWLDTETFRGPGLYLLQDVVFDSAARTSQTVASDSSFSLHVSVPPIGISPDGRSMVRFGYTESSTDHPALLVASLGGDRVYALPIDRTRMRYATEDELDPDWVLRHFEWRAVPGEPDRLVERAAFAPLPLRGTGGAER